MSRRPRPNNANERQDEWIWGNNRGGGGAPLKDAQGNVVTNLKGVTALDDNYSGGRDRSPPYNDRYEPSNQRTRRQETNYSRSPTKYREQDDYDDPSSPRRQPPPVGGSPGKKFMSALQDMYSNPREKMDKQRREMEYQDQLRAQIEEKQRLRKAEKDKEEEIKRREYDEYMNSVHASKPRKQLNSNAMRQQGDNEPSYGNGNRPPRKPRGGEDDPEDEEMDRREQAGRDPRDRARGPQGDRFRDGNYAQRGGERGRQSEPPDERDAPPPRRRPARDHSNDSDDRRGPPSQDKRFVSPEAYDELSALCDRLLQQQEQLQAELHQQASLIKELQRVQPPPSQNLRGGAVRSNDRVAPPQPPPQPPLRSKSVQQRRQEPAVQARREAPSLAQQRPSSMYQLSGAKEAPAKGLAPAAGGKGEARKVSKVAFGHPVVNKDGKDAGKRRAVPGLALHGEKAMQKVPPAASKASAPAARRGGEMSERGGQDGGDDVGPGRGGFSKLQARVQGGPVIVSYEEDDGGGGGGGASEALELRGQSRYVPVRGSGEHDYRGGGAHGDQLDRLLDNNRKGKFY